MPKVINAEPLSSQRFASVKHHYTDENGIQYVTHVLAIRDDKTGLINQHTGYELFCSPYTGKVPRYRKKDPRPHLCYVANVLNYIFKHNWWKYKVCSLADVTIDMIFDAFDNYIETPKDSARIQFRSQQSIDNYIYTVSSFFANVSLVTEASRVSAEDLFTSKKVFTKQKSKKLTVINVPIYKGRSMGRNESRLMRDIPDEAMDILVSQAELYDPTLVFPIVAGETTGMRLGEIVNMRQHDSPVSIVPGISFSRIGDTIVDVKIDLSKEYQLRSDGVPVGGIKKHRTLTIFKPFIPRFLKGYEYHTKLLSQQNYEKEYCPMIINSRGKAMTADNLADRFSHLVNKHFIPALYASGKPYLVAYAQELESKHLAPHMLRHRFTVKLALAGLDAEAIADYRGDNSAESAAVYVRNKGALDAELRKVHDFVIQDFI